MIRRPPRSTLFTRRSSDLTRAIASIGTGFKEPNFFENYATGFGRGNPDLQPEHSFTWEAGLEHHIPGDRKSTRLNSSHSQISDAAICLKKKTQQCSTSPVG